MPYIAERQGGDNVRWPPELEALHALMRQAEIVANGYIDCGTHYEFIGQTEDLELLMVRLREVDKLLSIRQKA